MHHTVDMFFDSNRRTKCLKQIVNNFPAHNKIPQDFYKDENNVELSGPRMYKKCRSKAHLFLKVFKHFSGMAIDPMANLSRDYLKIVNPSLSSDTRNVGRKRSIDSLSSDAFHYVSPKKTGKIR